jgi:hypothetical protein
VKRRVVRCGDKLGGKRDLELAVNTGAQKVFKLLARVPGVKALDFHSEHRTMLPP